MPNCSNVYNPASAQPGGHIARAEFGSAACPGNQVPISNPSHRIALTALIPAPNVTSADWPWVHWFATPTLPTHWRQELFKIDHNINDKVRASFRYIHDSWNQQYPVPLWTSGTTFPTIQTNFNNPGVSMVARLTANVTPDVAERVRRQLYDRPHFHAT